MAPISRRLALSSLAALAVAPLTACVSAPTPYPAPGSATTTPTPSASASGPPFALEAPSAVEAVVFDGAFGTGYVRLAGEKLEELHDGVTVAVRAAMRISDYADRFEDGGTPPDLVDNSGSGKLAISALMDDLTGLEDLVDAPNLEGVPIRETLYSGVIESGTFDGKLVALNYALTVYGLWYSGAEFAAQGWKVPTTWDEMLTLGDLVARDGRALFVWGEGAEGYFQELAISSAIKEGGHSVRVALDNLEAGSWQHPSVLGVLEAMELLVSAGHVVQGGPYLAAQDLWAHDRRALLYPSGAWIASETSASLADGFELTVAPVPTLTAAPTLPITAAHVQPTEQFIVPAKAANPAGAKELLRIMLSAEAAAAFSRDNLMPTVVRASSDTADPIVQAQTRLLADAGEHAFSWRFTQHYGLGPEHDALWSRFLSGDLGASALAEALQGISDRVRTDPDVERYTAS